MIMDEDKLTETKSELLVLAEAMNNLADALRDSNQLVRDMQMINPDPEQIGLIGAVGELAQRVAILSTRIR